MTKLHYDDEIGTKLIGVRQTDAMIPNNFEYCAGLDFWIGIQQNYFSFF